MEIEQEQTLHKIMVRVVIENSGEILLVRRSKADTRPGMWELPGGSVDAGETLEEAAKREIFEETGIELVEIAYLKSQTYKAGGVQRICAVFTSKVDKKMVHLSWEHDDYQWSKSGKLNNLQLESNNQTIVDTYLSTGKKETNVDMNTTKTLIADVYSDGGSRGNPGPSATGYVIYDSGKQVMAEGGEYLGITTNNQAEYQAVRMALEACRELGVQEINFYVDSLLVVNQMSGAFKIKNRDLWPIHESIKKLVGEFRRVDFTHIPREQNRFADAKVNEVLDGQAKA